MAPLHFQSFTKLLFSLVLFALLLVPPSSSSSIQLVGRRHLLEKIHPQQDNSDLSLKKKQGTTPYALGTTKNKTKLITPKPKSTTSSNSTKIQKLQEKDNKPILKKLNSTSKPSNTTNLTKPTSKTSNLTKPTSKTTNPSKPISKSTNPSKPTSKSTNSTKPISKTPKSPSILTQKSQDPAKKPTKEQKSTKKVNTLTYTEDDEDNDLVSEIKDLPARFQETFIPDLEMISTTSKAYITKANKHISKNFNPIVGKKYAPMVASIISFAFILIPFLLVSLIFNRIKAYFSLQKLIIFIQIYLSIYFSILSLSSLVTGLEPLNIVSKLLGLGQTFVGFAVGLHYYVTVFHRAVLRQPPKTSWKVHAVYATCFLLICLLGTMERRKKAYVVDGSEEEKKN
ncbi:hypothetical protein QVD17_09300 [Tagetes erecta]|uniref:Uncharacterized protein n=1 Tax=Tagetes erecta TaxID=13708 RepID=A0AAD8KZ31_TARER|nr:hypothetical protein QVD17_09300 [Tagetes erecta]